MRIIIFLSLLITISGCASDNWVWDPSMPGDEDYCREQESKIEIKGGNRELYSEGSFDDCMRSKGTRKIYLDAGEDISLDEERESDKVLIDKKWNAVLEEVRELEEEEETQNKK